MADRGKSLLSDTPNIVAAARDGNLGLVMQLVSQGHSLDARDKNGATALYWACSRGHAEVSKFLLSVGSDITAQVKWGATALLAAVDNGQEACVRQLLGENVDVNIANNRGDTPLHAAAYRGYANILRLLIEEGANPFIKNTASMTPLQEAYAQEQYECVKMLQEYMDVVPASISLSLPSSSAVTSYVGSSENTCKSWPCTPPSNRIMLSQEKIHTSLTSKRNAVCYSNIPTSLISNNDSPRSSTVLTPSGSELDNKSHITSSQTDSSSEDLCSRSSSDFISSSLSHSLAVGGSGHLSFDSLLSEALPVHCKPGCPQNAPLQRTFSSDFYQGVENKSASVDNLDITKHSSLLYHLKQEVETPPKLLPRKTTLVPLGITEKENRSFLLRHISSSPTHERQSKKTKFLGDVLPGLKVNEFLEQLQIGMVDLQEKLHQANSLNEQLKEQLIQIQQENAQLKNENSNLRSLVYQHEHVSLKARGVSDSFVELRHLPELSKIPLSMKVEQNACMREKRAVESSETEGGACIYKQTS